MRREVTKPIRKAESILKKAEKSNVKLANYDERVRDPMIANAPNVPRFRGEVGMAQKSSRRGLPEGEASGQPPSLT